MANQILPNAICYLQMTDDELREELCREIYNNANYREMIRRLVKLAQEFADARDYVVEQSSECMAALCSIKRTIYELGDIE